jgi:hypothetical protein
MSATLAVQIQITLAVSVLVGVSVPLLLFLTGMDRVVRRAVVWCLETVEILIMIPMSVLPNPVAGRHRPRSA